MAIIGQVAELWRYPFKSMAGESLTHSTVGALGLPGDRGWAVRDEAAGEIRGAKKLPQLLQCRAAYRSDPGDTGVPPADIVFPDGTSSSTDDPQLPARLTALLGRTVTVWPRQPATDEAHYRRAQPDGGDMIAEMRAIFGRTEEEPLPDLTMFPAEVVEFTSPRGTYFDAYPLQLLTTASLAALRTGPDDPRFDRRRFRPNVLIDTGAATGLLEAGWQGGKIRIGSAIVTIEVPTVRCVMITLPQDDLPKEPGVLRAVVRDAAQCMGAYASVTTPGTVAVGDDVEVL